MKKTLLSAVALSMLLPATYAQNVDSSSVSSTSVIKTKWGFDATSSSQVKANVDWTSLSVSFPIITDGQWNPVYNYQVYYSKKDILEAAIDEVMQVKVNLVSSTNKTDKYEFSYNAGDKTASVKLLWLDPNTKYYVFLQPQTSSGTQWEMSQTITATTSDVTATSTSATATSATSTTSSVHNAAWMDSTATLKNASYEQNGDQVTLYWASINWDQKVQVFLRKDTQSDSEYQQIANANAKDWKAIIPVPAEGSYMAKLVLTDASGNTLSEKVLAVKIDKLTPVSSSTPSSVASSTPKPTPTTPKPTIVKTPHVGPAQDALMLTMVLVALGYTWLRLRKSK